MGYIGTKPSAVPLTSADITDGIIVNADISSTAGITLNKISGNPNFRNRIINGNMQIDQRNAGASVTPTANVYTLDRWYALVGSASKMSFQQSTTTATGFFNSALATTVTAYSVSGTDTFAFLQPIEGFNVADLGFGTANAKTVTLSFWVRSSLTGTFGGALSNDGYNRSYPFTYTISTANTFEYKTITIAGDTSGTWTKDNSAGLRVYLGLGVGATYSGTAGAWSGAFYASATGATSVVGTGGATFYLTGVQLEAGTSATDFEFLPIDVSLGRCQRYFQKIESSADWQSLAGRNDSSTEVYANISLPTSLRASPTLNNPNFNYFDSSSSQASSGGTTTVRKVSNNNSFLTLIKSGFTSLTGNRISVITPTQDFTIDSEL